MAQRHTALLDKIVATVLAASRDVTYTLAASRWEKLTRPGSSGTPLLPVIKTEARIMLASGFATLDVTLWTTWAPLGAGAVVTSLVVGGGVAYGCWRGGRGLSNASREEDLAWADLLALLEQRNRDRAAAGLPPEEATDEELGQLLARLPAMPDPRALELPEDREFGFVGHDERRAGVRRWGNPTEVHLRSLRWTASMHGLVVNRSTGGLGIFVDKEVPHGTPMQVRAADAPAYVPAALVDVRHSLKVGKGFILGCRFSTDVPWNVRVWFG
jgi:hypothetical protein